MSCCGSPTPPPAPDPNVVSAAQTKSNIDTAKNQQVLNMINTVGPDGSVTYDASGAPGGYTQTTTLSAAQQHLYDLINSAKTGALGIANDQLGRVGTALGQTLNPGGVQTSFDQGPALQYGVGAQMPIQYGVNPNTGVQMGYDQGGPIQRGVSQTALQSGFNPGQHVQGQVGAGDFNQSMQNASNAVYGQMTSRLDPQWNLQQREMETKLANQGLSQNSDAYKGAMDQFNREKTDAYQTANNNAVQIGQGVQQQGYGQQLSSGNFANQAAAQEYGQNQGQAQFFNDASNNRFSQGLQQGNFANAAQQQQNTQNANQAEFNNAAAGQQFGQNAAANQAWNQAQNQGFNQGLATTQLNNATAGQQYNQNQGAATFGNQANSQQFQQTAYAQNQPINQFNSLMSSGQVGMPTGINYTPSEIQPTNVLGAYQLNSQVASNNYTQQMQNQGDLLGGIFKLGAAGISKYSDVRLKEDIRPAGRLPSGLGLYSYRYRGSAEREVGVLAQDALRTHPHAVFFHPSGFLMVDYGALD